MRNDVRWFIGLCFVALLAAILFNKCSNAQGVQEALRTRAYVRTSYGSGSGVWLGDEYFLTARHIFGDSTQMDIFFRNLWFRGQLVAEDGDVALVKSNYTKTGKKRRTLFADVVAVGEPIYWIQPHYMPDAVLPLLVDGLAGYVRQDTLFIGTPGFPGASGTGIFNQQGKLISVGMTLMAVQFSWKSPQIAGFRSLLVSGMTNIRRYLADESISR